MKLTIDLDNWNPGESDETLGELLRNVIKDEVTTFIRKEVKAQLRSKEAEIKRMVADIADRDWRKLAVMLAKVEPA